MNARSRNPATWVFVMLGCVLGSGALLGVAGCGDEAFVETQWIKPWAEAQDVEIWHAEWERRAKPWTDVPDPPGRGPVERASFWVSRAPYAMEVRRRGTRITLGIHGVDEQELGGGWAAFGEGWIHGPASGFAGAVATFSWSCLGIRYRSASDGFGRITFSDDGATLAAVYVAHEAGDVWFKSYGRRGDTSRPSRGVIRGQIPFTAALRKLPANARYELDVDVVDEFDQPLPGAVVRLKGVPASAAVVDRSGRARIRFFGRDAPFAQGICAGKEGYYNGETIIFTGDERPGLREGAVAPHPVRVMLLRADLEDHPAYEWNHPAKDHDADDAMACATCHTWHYDEWLSSRHARSGDNGLVLHERRRMRRQDAAAPDDCAGCHTPGRAAVTPHEPLRVGGMLAANHCDFCHKISRVTDLRQSGVFGALELARPDPARALRPGGIHHVFGPLPDATYAYMGAIYNPLFAASHLCAACHQGGGRWRDGSPPKVDTFEEWRRWAVAEGAAQRPVKSCQDCHMPGATTIDVDGHAVDQIAWDALHRSPESVHSHRFLGREPAFAAKALDVRIVKERIAEDEWLVTVTLKNVGAGHSIPTGTWTKHVVVGVWARGADGWLASTGGDQLNSVGTRGPVLNGPGDYPGAAGTVLGMTASDQSPGRTAFWMPWQPADLVDERLAPGATRTILATYACSEAPDVEVRVVHRRGNYTNRATFPVRAYDAPPEVEWLRIRR